MLQITTTKLYIMSTFTKQELKDFADNKKASFIEDGIGQIRVVHTLPSGELFTQKFVGSDKIGFTQL